MTNHKSVQPVRVLGPAVATATDVAHQPYPHLNLNISPDPLLALTPDGMIVDVNARAAEMFGCHARLMAGAHIGAFLGGLPGTAKDPSIERLISALIAGDGMPIETEAHKLNGGSLPVEVTSRTQVQDGVTLIICATRDITHRKHNETALTKAKESAERANVAKLEFLGQLSHELRTPLATAIGFAEVMRDEMFGPIGIKLYQTYAADICKSGQQLANVVERIIDVTRLEGSMAIAHTRMADLMEIVERAIERHSGAASIQGVRVTHNLRRGSIPVVLDDDSLSQMIGHVIENAIKYNRFGGRVEIGGSIEIDRSRDVQQVFLTITDNGPGFATDQLQRLQKSLDANQHQENGGLALCSAFLHLMGGQLSICSAPNLGTTATLSFPQRYDGRWRP